MRTRIVLAAGCVLALTGCALPPHVAEVMPDSKLCGVRAQPVLFGYRSDESTTRVIDGELQTRDASCPQS